MAFNQRHFTLHITRTFSVYRSSSSTDCFKFPTIQTEKTHEIMTAYAATAYAPPCGKEH